MPPRSNACSSSSQSGGQSLVREIERQRDEASTNLDFEGAAALHARLEKVKAAVAQLPEIVRRLDELNGVMVQPSAERESVTLFKIAAGQDLRAGGAQCRQAGRSIALPRAAIDGGAHHEALAAGGSLPSYAARWNGWSTWRCSSAGTIAPRKSASCS